MKKTVAFLLCVVISFGSLFGCAGKAPADDITGVEGSTSELPSGETGTAFDPSSWETEDPETILFSKDEYPHIDGSTSTKPLAKEIEEEFTGQKDVVITHSKSIQSYSNLINGKCDMLLTVEPSPREYALAEEKNVKLRIDKVTNEGFVFFVNKRNPVESLTLEEIRGIYSGKITNWKVVGGLDAEIIAFQRPTSSGSQTGMESLVMGDTPMMEPVTGRVSDSMNEIVDVISAFDSGEFAIGYSYYYYANTMYLGENVKLIAVNGVKPNNTTIREGNYPLLTGYYAVTREGDVTENTWRLLQGILSERGQRAVQRAGYVPVLDVGNVEPGPEETYEKTISLNETYSGNPIRILTRKGLYEETEYSYLEIDGLRDLEVQAKINRMLREDAESTLKNGFEKATNGQKLTQNYSMVTASFGNVLSVRSRSYFSRPGARQFYTAACTNVRLDTGERLELRDLFKSTTKGKAIFNADFYGDTVFRTSKTGAGEDYQIRVEDYMDAEDRILSLVQSFDAGEEIEFSFSPRGVTLENQPDTELGLDLWFTNCMEEVTIYHKFADAENLYDGRYPKAEGIPVLTERGVPILSSFEETDAYFLDAACYLNAEIPDRVLKVLLDQYGEYLKEDRAEMKKAASAGQYEIHVITAYLEKGNGDGTEEGWHLSISTRYHVLNSKEQLKNTKENAINILRNPYSDLLTNYNGSLAYYLGGGVLNLNNRTAVYRYGTEGNLLGVEE